LNEYWEIIDDTTMIATVLDSNAKCSIFTQEENTKAINIVKNEMNSYIENNKNTNTNENNTTTVPILPSNQAFNRLDARAHLRNLANKFRPTTQPVPNNELERYLSLPQDEDCDPLTWWSSHQKNFPILSAIAKNHLAIQSTSVACEQSFSIAGLTISKLRNRLDSETARAILCLKSWISETIGENNIDDQPDSDDDEKKVNSISK